MDKPLKIFEIPIDITKSIYTMPAPICSEDKLFYGQELLSNGIVTVISLLSPIEIAVHCLQEEEKIYQNLGISFLNFPITDFGTPKDTNSFLALVYNLKARIKENARIAIHCKAGIGRSSLLAGAILVSFGHDEHQVFDYISTYRKALVPDKQSQVEYLISIVSKLKS